MVALGSPEDSGFYRVDPRGINDGGDGRIEEAIAPQMSQMAADEKFQMMAWSDQAIAPQMAKMRKDE
jgi:hypothetical protein